MPKASKVGKFRASARNVKESPLTADCLAGKKGPSSDDAPPAEKESLSRGQRKRLAKREQYLKKEKMVMSSLRLQKLEEQKTRIDGLDAIKEALGEAAASASAKEKAKADDAQKKMACNTNKSKKRVANSEISHMGLVLQHPSFQDNPFAAIQTHLKNSLAADAEKLQQEAQIREEKDTELEAKKKEERKERIRDAKFSKKGRKGGRGFKSSRAKRI
ncbi:hypothetical protein ACHAXT_004743 [Thalassiosira profunda]